VEAGRFPVRMIFSKAHNSANVDVTRYISYREFADRVDLVASGLIELGVLPGEIWNVYSKTSYVYGIHLTLGQIAHLERFIALIGS
jgi:long-subunit acyl-CoA synthetase (AMP-forming)